jgi:hypothetical protein
VGAADLSVFLRTWSGWRLQMLANARLCWLVTCACVRAGEGGVLVCPGDGGWVGAGVRVHVSVCGVAQACVCRPASFAVRLAAERTNKALLSFTPCIMSREMSPPSNSPSTAHPSSNHATNHHHPIADRLSQRPSRRHHRRGTQRQCGRKHARALARHSRALCVVGRRRVHAAPAAAVCGAAGAAGVWKRPHMYMLLSTTTDSGSFFGRVFCSPSLDRCPC